MQIRPMLMKQFKNYWVQLSETIEKQKQYNISQFVKFFMSCPCYKSKLQFDESLRVEHLPINIHSHNSGSVLALKLEEISQKLVLGWVQFRAVAEVVFSYGEFFKQRNMIKEVINKQNTTKYFSRCD
ncbi:Hypothetical_protein [Hexamita inflata]|uniref:Hypothetical_protein n=1 Tax=Hexamita inflata TaxID=28002 RepID=A0AA86Q730_9EUKA|nr:Hypothetical protein HINF_LOCUS41046 [Hexamita inflata]